MGLDFTAKWSHWKDIDRCELWRAVVLTLDIEPRVFTVVEQTGTLTPSAAYKQRLAGDYNQEISERLAAARSQLGRDLKCLAYHQHEHRSDISLPQFGSWAPAAWNLPDQFPREGAAMGKAASGANSGAVSISLPHTTKDLEALFAIIRGHWADATKPPKADAVGFAIDKAMGWKSSAKPSRTAQSIAGMIRPDDQAATDKRSRRRRKNP